MGTVKRFPMALLSAFFGTVVMIGIAESADASQEHLLQRLAVMAALALPLFIAIGTWSESKGWKAGQVWLLRLAGMALLAAYFFSLPTDITEFQSLGVRAFLLWLGLHFLVAIGPWLGGSRVQGFWKYNITLFLRGLVTALYSAVLYAGLAIALAAADYLFGAEVAPKRYGELWIIIAGLFSPWMFLAGVPKDLHALDADPSYPRGLKVFAQFVLLPLVGLYFVILVSYEIKILLEWNWPKGWVSQLVLWYAVVGILSTLLLYPLRNLAENRWLRIFITWYFRLLAPLVAMLFWAIGERISEYGVTEPRYFVVAMAVGLTVVMFYFIFSRTKDIRVVPIVLCLIAILSSFGPWGAFSISRSSQQARLQVLLEKNGFWADGVLTKPERAASEEDNREMSSIVAYLNEWHGPAALDRWLDDSTLATLESVSRFQRPDQMALHLGFAYVSNWHGPNGSDWFSFRAAESFSTSVAGYDYLINLNESKGADSVDRFVLGLDTLGFRRGEQSPEIRLALSADGEHPADTVQIDLSAPLLAMLVPPSDRALTPDSLSFPFEGTRFDGSLLVRLVTGRVVGDSVSVTMLRGQILVRKKDEAR